MKYYYYYYYYYYYLIHHYTFLIPYFYISTYINMV